MLVLMIPGPSSLWYIYISPPALTNNKIYNKLFVMACIDYGVNPDAPSPRELLINMRAYVLALISFPPPPSTFTIENEA